MALGGNSSKARESGAGEAAGSPLGLQFRAEGLIEVDGRLVPVEDGPFHAPAAARVGEFSELKQQGLADALAAEFGAHEEVFEVEAGFREEGGVVKEVEGEPGRLVVVGEKVH